MKFLAEKRAKQLSQHFFRIQGCAACSTIQLGVDGTHVIYVLHDAKKPELYGGLPSDPHVPWSVQLWKKPLKWLGNIAMIGGVLGVAT